MIRSTWDLIQERKPLTEEEQKLQWAELYNRPIKGPDAEAIYALREGIVFDEADVIYNLADLITDQPLKVEYGYWNLSNGCTHVGALNRFYGVTLEEYNWWRKWRFDCSPEDELLRYKLWCPGSHISQTHEGGEVSVEDMGYGPVALRFLKRIGNEEVLSPELMEKAEQLGIQFFLSMTAVPSITTDDYIPGIVLHVARSTDYGFEMRSRFWDGFVLENGMLKPALPEGAKIHPLHAYCLAQHNIHEMACLRELIPLVYKK